jgi:chemotaxis protein MotB
MPFREPMPFRGTVPTINSAASPAGTRRRVAVTLLLGLTFVGTGCNVVPRRQLAMAQARTRQLHEQNKMLAAEKGQAIASVQGENQRLQQQIADLNSARDTLQQRVDNLLAERSTLQSKISNVSHSPLSSDTTRAFEELARKYPEFEFDPLTGVSKFNTDILFELGKDDVRTGADPMLREFVRILNSGDATNLQVLVSGHTDDRPVVKAETKARHRDNWDLSAHRASAVVRTLSRLGLKDNRMGLSAYGPYQPVATAKDEKSRQRNRRVEIYVLAPNSPLANYDGLDTFRQ